MTNDELMSKTISYLRYPLTVTVVMAHFNFANTGFGIHGVMYGLDKPDWYRWIINFFGTTLVGLGVPLFFIIAGYFFFGRKPWNMEAYKSKLQTRLHTLLIPYLIWNTLAILLIAIRFLPIFKSLVPGMEKIELNLTLSGLINTYFDNFHQNGLFIYPEALSSKTTIMPIDAPLWFVRDLMAVAIISPLLYWLIKNLRGWAVVGLGLISYVIFPLVGVTGYLPMLTDAAFFFSWGAYYGINKLNLVAEMRKLKYVPYIYVPVAILDTITTGPIGSTLHYGGIPLGAITAIIVASYLLESGKVKVNETLSNGSFFIFSMHMLIMWELGKVIFTVLHLNDNTFVLLAFYFAIPAITILICLATYILLGKYLPGVRKLLTGGR